MALNDPSKRKYPPLSGLLGPSSVTQTSTPPVKPAGVPFTGGVKGAVPTPQSVLSTVQGIPTAQADTTPPATQVTPAVPNQPSQPNQFGDFGAQMGDSRFTNPGTPAPTRRGLFQNVAESLAARSSQPSEAFTEAQGAYERASKDWAGYKSLLNEKLGLEEGRAIPLEFVQGRQQTLQRQGEAGIAARQEALSRAATQQQVALQQQNLEQQALYQAAGLAPEATRFEAFGGGQMSPDNVASQYAQQVRAGTMSPEQAKSEMSSLFGGAGDYFLNQALQSGGQAQAGYDYIKGGAGAAARATDITQTGSLGGPLGKAAESANQALDTLQQKFDALSKLQQGKLPGIGSNIPFVSGLVQQASLLAGPGREAASAYQGALNEGRAQISAVLAPVVGVDAARSTAVGLLPDNMLPTEIPQKIQAAKEYIQQRVNAFTQPVLQGNQGTQAGGGSASAGGYNFKQVNGQWVPA